MRGGLVGCERHRPTSRVDNSSDFILGSMSLTRFILFMLTVLTVLNIISFVIGAGLVYFSLNSAIHTFVLPRAAPNKLIRIIFRSTRRLFNIACVRAKDYAARDRIMALYGPATLLASVPTFLFFLLIGFTFIFWGTGGATWLESFELSGSSLFTLGFVGAKTVPDYILSFLEAASGTVMTALLIAYLPTIYGVFSQREAGVNLMATRLGDPPWAVTLIERTYQLSRLESLSDVWVEWERWFVTLEESHSSLTVLAFFRSQQPNRSWVTTSGVLLDAAALIRSSVDIPANPRADLMIRAGYLALRSVCLPYGIEVPKYPEFPRDTISIKREEFETAYDHLAGVGVPMKPDREQAWLDFAGWRVNYDVALVTLCDVVMAPEAPWSSDRCHGRWELTPRFKTPNRVEDEELQYKSQKEAELPNLPQFKREMRRNRIGQMRQAASSNRTQSGAPLQ